MTTVNQTAPISVVGPVMVEKVAEARLPTREGFFTIVGFRNNKDGLDHVALVRGDVRGAHEVPTRLHSECLTGDVFHSLRCDCREQLERAIDEFAHRDRGIILYMRQEGRGIGLTNKIAAYALQDRGLDTVDANLHLGFDDDLREYDVAGEMLKLLGVASIELLTNNLRKVEGLRESGVLVSARRPIIITANPHNRRYLETKRRRSGHLLDRIE
ncbi:MAG: GTP cyclohydrolase II [Myxococcota bacterium]|jgi:GTP cyclohydrolase II|nr:GTP cyclohydrolase II [Myxococcota bacterium]